MVWPLFGLRVRTPRLVLRYPDDHDVMALAELAAAGIHDPETMPFSVPWTDAPPSDLRRNTVQHYWLTRGEWSVNRWRLPMAVVHDGAVVGVQDLFATDFPVLRAVATGSWLGLGHQGRGIGTEMRAAILHLAFAGLGAEHAYSGAFDDNAASRAVSAKLGYEDDGRKQVVRRGQPAWLTGYRLARHRWEQQRRADIAIDGLDACAELFGLA
jgi:RimJ/RimL family protein N-acetyltransferase